MIPLVKVVSKGNNGNGRASAELSEDDPDGWMDSAIPVDSVIGATAAAAGLISEQEVLSFSSKGSDPPSPVGNAEVVSPAPLAEAVEDASQGDTVVVANEVHSEEGGGEPHHLADDVQSPSREPQITQNGDHATSNGTVPGPSERPPRVLGHERMESSDSVYRWEFLSSRFFPFRAFSGTRQITA